MIGNRHSRVQTDPPSDKPAAPLQFVNGATPSIEGVSIRLARSIFASLRRASMMAIWARRRMSGWDGQSPSAREIGMRRHAVFRGDAELARFLLGHGARERHGFGDNVHWRLSCAPRNEPEVVGDWHGFAETPVARHADRKSRPTGEAA
jgi:hypothetical protein